MTDVRYEQIKRLISELSLHNKVMLNEIKKAKKNGVYDDYAVGCSDTYEYVIDILKAIMKGK
jgi:hypothetical protein